MGGSAANVRSMRAIGALCQDAGLRVMEASGWVDRGRTWSTLKPEYVVVHHTAATVDVDRLLIEGRSDLPGPLCNFALHADGTVVLIASGLANHCGVASVSSDQAYGIEATGPIPISGSGTTAFPQHDEYLTLCAAIRLHHGWGSNRVLAHKEVARPDGRKPDPAFGSRFPAPYPDMGRFRAAVDQRVQAWGLEDDVSAAEVIAWFKSEEGIRVLRKAVYGGSGEEIPSIFGTVNAAQVVEAAAKAAQGANSKAGDLTTAVAAVAARVTAIETDVDKLVAGDLTGGGVVVAPLRLSPHEIAQLAIDAGWIGDDLRTAVAVCLAESGGDTGAMGRSDTGASLGNRDHGLWQISGRWHGDKLIEHPDWRTPATNAALAHRIWTDAGQKWTPWAVFNSGAYEKYLPDADIALAAPWPVSP